ncbi:hypothetical protein EDD16DRAFT_323264 [Pisolithus croceorrhizus]|nr:hypothetical protein EDD16DRAFT_323264 [Pisolithus croceorrhizus]KAI6130981.1 hypothetical protein EV401DRAFT_487281 [Pisolithus croceorrhizus]
MDIPPKFVLVQTASIFLSSSRVLAQRHEDRPRESIYSGCAHSHCEHATRINLRGCAIWRAVIGTGTARVCARVLLSRVVICNIRRLESQSILGGQRGCATLPLLSFLNREQVFSLWI